MIAREIVLMSDLEELYGRSSADPGFAEVIAHCYQRALTLGVEESLKNAAVVDKRISW